MVLLLLRETLSILFVFRMMTGSREQESTAENCCLVVPEYQEPSWGLLNDHSVQYFSNAGDQSNLFTSDVTLRHALSRKSRQRGTIRPKRGVVTFTPVSSLQKSYCSPRYLRFRFSSFDLVSWRCMLYTAFSPY
jgi:hypothetical protein